MARWYTTHYDATRERVEREQRAHLADFARAHPSWDQDATLDAWEAHIDACVRSALESSPLSGTCAACGEDGHGYAAGGRVGCNACGVEQDAVDL